MGGILRNDEFIPGTNESDYEAISRTIYNCLISPIHLLSSTWRKIVNGTAPKETTRAKASGKKRRQHPNQIKGARIRQRSRRRKRGKRTVNKMVKRAVMREPRTMLLRLG